MEFICQKDLLQKAIQHTERIVSARSTLPVLANLLFEVNGAVLKITSTDMEIGIEKKVKISTSKPGSVLINSKTISSIVNKLPDADVKLKVLDNQTIEITCAQSHFNIHGLPAEEFPQIPKIENGVEFQINKDNLKDLIKQTIISVSIDESKHILNGVLVEIDSDSLIGVATDGYRLSQKSIKEKHEISEKIRMIIPTKALHELLSITAEGKEEKIKVNYSDSMANFTFEDFYLSTRLIKGQYPDYKQVIPKEFKTEIMVSKEEFTDALERCQIIASSSANIVKIEVLDDKLLINASTPDIGNVNEMISISKNNDHKLQIALNVRLLLEALKIISADKIKLSLIDSLKPGTISPVSDKKDDEFLYVVMPIRTAENK
ncbi:MAG: DNA polymerase III subunit beta [Candidatus Margulisiibacteriota bacterium]|jgi:DNA polymerase-3 subunit beta